MTTPVLQWTGGKRRLVPELLREIPGCYRTYYEPFSGGLALFFALHDMGKFVNARLADMNPDLINFYTCLRDEPEALITLASELATHQTEDDYYTVRAWEPTGVASAARMLYLNRTCFNALWRVNKAGKFNVPWGKKVKPALVDAEALRGASRALQGVAIALLDCVQTISYAELGDLVYADPPYFPASDTANFVAYAVDGFSENKQTELAAALRAAAQRGARVVVSNADTLASRTVYAGFDVRVISVARNAGCKVSTRGKVQELIATMGPL